MEFVIALQVIVSVIIGAYFFSMLKGKRTAKVSIDSESRRQMDRLNRPAQHIVKRPAFRKNTTQGIR